MGRRATEALLSMIEGQGAESIFLPPSVTLRESVRHANAR
jgi:DNA-binding LacI/PurR family transcriptional regulator